MGNDDDIVETIKEEVADAAKAVVADVKAIAHEVADAIAEGVCGEHVQHIRPPDDDDDSKAKPSADVEGGGASRKDDAADK